MQPVCHEWDAARLGRLCDAMESNNRGLQALEIDQSTYQSIVVPAIARNLPDTFRFQISRGEDVNNWPIDKLLDVLRTEVELREEYGGGLQKFEKKSMKPVRKNRG